MKRMHRVGPLGVMAAGALAAGCGRLGYDLLPGPSGGAEIARSAGGTSGSDAALAGGAAGSGTPGTGGAAPFDGGTRVPADGGGGWPLTDGGTPDASTDATIPRSPPTVSATCGFGALTVIQDSNAGDNAASATLAAAIRNGCGTAPTTRTVSQNARGVLDPATGRPLLGPRDLGVAAGGPSSAQRVTQYLDISDTPLRLNSSRPGTYEIDERATGRAIVRAMLSALGPTHDFALVMIVYEPIGKSTVVSTYARGTEGTSAGAFWFASGAPGPISSSTRRWYVVEWTNADGTAGPSAGDTFTLIASG